MKHYLLYILSCLILVSVVSCSGSSRELTEEEIEISEELKARFEGRDLLVYSSDTLLASSMVLDFYSSHEYQPIWIGKSELNERGIEMFQMVEDARDYGLVPEMFNHGMLAQMKDTSLLDAEMLLTNAFFLYATHVDAGCIDPITYEYVWKKDSIDFDLNAELESVIEGNSVKSVIESHQPKVWEYQQLQAGLADFLDKYPLDTNTYDIPAFKEDSVKCYAAAHEALMGHSFIDENVSKQDSAFINQLKEFQRVNGLLDDAIVGKWTGRALNKSNMDRFYSGALALEKWRWKKAYPDKYIRVNIPEFTLYFVDSAEIKSKHRVVVGAYATQTPEFEATMRRMVTNPFWHVPYSIASTEILYGARKDSGYFRKRGYKIFQDGAQVDPKTVNWSDVRQGNFKYKVRQNGGGGNSLGRIKFLFPNVHSVFVHDTPSKRLFQNDVRAYSHGCVRLHRPFDLAKAIMVADQSEMVADTLDSLVYRGVQRVIELEDPFQVYIEYITATGDSSGNVIFHPDIYGRDTKYIEKTYKPFDRRRIDPANRKENSEIASNP